MWTLYSANKSQISMWKLDTCDYATIMTSPNWWATCQFWGRKWQLWFDTEGEKGTEPPAEVKEFVNIWREMPWIVNEEERISKGKKALELLSENLWFIGVTSEQPSLWVVRKSLKNVNLEIMADDDYEFREGFQWYFEK